MPADSLVLGYQAGAPRLCVGDDETIKGIAAPVLLEGVLDDRPKGQLADPQPEIVTQRVDDAQRIWLEPSNLVKILQLEYGSGGSHQILVLNGRSGSLAQLFDLAEVQAEQHVRVQVDHRSSLHSFSQST